jgi:hypothetical protein
MITRLEGLIMLPFILYVVTGVVTGLHVYTLMFAGFGIPFNPLELVSLLGSLCLLIAAYLSLFKPYAAARLALVAALAMWCFYGPAIANRVRAHLGRPAAVSQYTLPLSDGAPGVSLPDNLRF